MAVKAGRCLERHDEPRPASTHILVDRFGIRILNSQMCPRHAANARRRGESVVRLEDAKERDW